MVKLLIERLGNLVWPARMPDELVKRIINCAEIYHFSKGDFLLKKGQVCNGAHFLVKGLARSWCKIEKAEATTRLMDEGFIITCWKSYYYQQPAEENIVAIEPCTTIYLSRRDIYDLYKEFEVFNTIGRKQVEYSFCQADERTNMMRLSAKSRYRWFCEKHPQLLKRVTQRDIASFLGMNYETLSRVRKSEKKGGDRGQAKPRR